MTSLEKQELNALSKEVFGKPSKWQKLVEKGMIVDGMDPNSPPDNSQSWPTHHIKRFTVEEIKIMMLDTIAENKKRRDEANRKQAIVRNLTGSVGA